MPIDDVAHIAAVVLGKTKLTLHECARRIYEHSRNPAIRGERDADGILVNHAAIIRDSLPVYGDATHQAAQHVSENPVYNKLVQSLNYEDVCVEFEVEVRLDMYALAFIMAHYKSIGREYVNYSTYVPEFIAKHGLMGVREIRNNITPAQLLEAALWFEKKFYGDKASRQTVNLFAWIA